MNYLFLLPILLLVISSQAATPAGRIPAAPKGVVDLEFGELLCGPVGERGLALSEKASNLNGKKVRVIGYMVRQEHATPGVFLLAPVPVQLHQDHYGLADDLPPTTIYVSIPAKPHVLVPHQPGPLAITGTLRMASREESDGRISIFRLELDALPRARKSVTPPGSKTGQIRLSAQRRKL
jgi:hypothetical protein